MEILSRGLLRLAVPLVRRRMQRELERDIATMKAKLEGAERTSVDLPTFGPGMAELEE